MNEVKYGAITVSLVVEQYEDNIDLAWQTK